MTRRRRFETGLMALLLLLALSLSWALPGPMATRAESHSIQPSVAPTVPPLTKSSVRASFSIHYKGLESPFAITSALVLPGETLSVEAVSRDANADFEAEAPSGTLLRTGVGRWAWTAPTLPGIYPIVVKNSLQSSITLNGLVMEPYRPGRSSINGYPIGFYPNRPFKNNPIYLPPKGLVEVTEANRDTLLTPHFRLGQFVCKQEAGFPKYVLMEERLLLKLELILEEMNRRGHNIETFEIMSGYRTPAYNRSLKNVRYSLHQWGFAADVYVDQNPRDEFMDDLNGDGRINYRDAEVISSVVAQMDQNGDFLPFKGGLGGYKTGKFGPFVHVDVRGWDARWGLQPKVQPKTVRAAVRSAARVNAD